MTVLCIYTDGWSSDKDEGGEGFDPVKINPTNNFLVEVCTAFIILYF